MTLSDIMSAEELHQMMEDETIESIKQIENLLPEEYVRVLYTHTTDNRVAVGMYRALTYLELCLSRKLVS